MGLELERKYPGLGVDDLDALRIALRRQGAICHGAHFEENWVFDKNGELRARGALLRLRTQQWPGRISHLLTLKLPVPALEAQQEVKAREERETPVADARAMRNLLQGLGYTVVARYEKVREPWLLEGVEVELDVLPFGQVVELEGPTAGMETVERRLGLNPAAASNRSYHELHQAWRARQAMPPQDSFVFDNAARAAWRTALGLSS